MHHNVHMTQIKKIQSGKGKHGLFGKCLNIIRKAKCTTVIFSTWIHCNNLYPDFQKKRKKERKIWLPLVLGNMKAVTNSLMLYGNLRHGLHYTLQKCRDELTCTLFSCKVSVYAPILFIMYLPSFPPHLPNDNR